MLPGRRVLEGLFRANETKGDLGAGPLHHGEVDQPDRILVSTYTKVWNTVWSFVWLSSSNNSSLCFRTTFYDAYGRPT